MARHPKLSTARPLKFGAIVALLVACSEGATNDDSGAGQLTTGGAATQGSGGANTGGTLAPTGGAAPATGGVKPNTGGAPPSTGGVTTGGVSSSGAPNSGGSMPTGGATITTGGTASTGTGGSAGSGSGSGGIPNGGTPSAAGAAGAASGGVGGGSAGSGSVTPPSGANSVAYIGCSMAWNIGNGYKRVGGKVMWNSDSYQTSAMVVQNWTDAKSSSWNLFDQKMSSIGGKDAVKAVMIQICIFSSRATDAELKSLITSARQHVNPGTHIYLVGQPQYEAGHDCSLAGSGGAQWTDEQAKKLAGDSSINQDVTYLGRFLLDSTKGEVSSDSCHATSSGEDVLGKQAMAFFGG